jgi:hypothetical protein
VAAPESLCLPKPHKAHQWLGIDRGFFKAKKSNPQGSITEADIS